MQDRCTSFEVPLPVAAQQDIDHLCSEFEAQWRRDEQPRIEDYLSRVASPLVPWLLKELVAAEVDLRRATSDDVQVADYLQRFPAHAAAVEAGWALIANRWAEDPGPASTVNVSRNVHNAPKVLLQTPVVTSSYIHLVRLGAMGSEKSSAKVVSAVFIWLVIRNCSARWRLKCLIAEGSRRAGCGQAFDRGPG